MLKILVKLIPKRKSNDHHLNLIFNSNFRSITVDSRKDKNKSRTYIIISSTATLCAISAGILLTYRSISSKNTDLSKPEPEIHVSQEALYLADLKSHLVNKAPLYIETPNIENLISLPRYQNALILIKQAKLDPNKSNIQKCVDELTKLSDYGYNTDSNDSSKLDDLLKATILQNKWLKARRNPFLSDGLAIHISQMLSDELAIQLAFRSPNVDNRFFRTEPPSTIIKLNKILSKNTKVTSIYDDPGYSLLFEFYNNFAKKIEQQESKFYFDKDILGLISKLHAEMRSLIVSEYFIKQRPKQSIWSSTDTDFLLDDLDDENIDYLLADLKQNKKEISSKSKTLKQKKKNEFLIRNESLMIGLVEKMAKLDVNEFIKLGGMEMLLLIYEKHKLDELYLNKIGNCLTLISLSDENRTLFVQSGWLKRLNQMCNKEYKLELENNLDLFNELIGNKILFNLNQNQLKPSLFYSTMIYPLSPLNSPALDQTNHLLDYERSKANSNKNHQHVIDIIFVHGLQGSLFKTWRQQDPVIVNKYEPHLIDKLSTMIEKHLSNKYTYCWPKDWLSADLINEIDKAEKDNIYKYRLMAINYDSLYSLWGQEVIDEKRLKSSIKQRAIDLVEQLELAHVGNRPCVWVCHSMGGLIVKQLLVHLQDVDPDNNELLKNTKAIVFLSTPHLGSTIAKTLSKFSFATNPSNEVFELSSNSKYLVEMNKKFIELIKLEKKEINILSLCENSPTHMGFNIYGKTVTEASANLGLGEFHLVDGKDHFSICKPAGRDCFVYLKIKNLINQLILNENLNCEKCKYDILDEKERKLNENLFEILKLSYFY